MHMNEYVISSNHLNSSSGMCLQTGVDYKFILLRSDMPDWRKLAPALRKFVKLIMEDNVYNAAWRVVTINEGYKDNVSIHTIHANSEALIMDFERWSGMRNYLKQVASQDAYLKAYPQEQKKLQEYEDNIFTYHRFFDHVLYFAKRMFVGHEQDDTQNLRADVIKLWEAVVTLPERPRLRTRTARTSRSHRARSRTPPCWSAPWC